MTSSGDQINATNNFWKDGVLDVGVRRWCRLRRHVRVRRCVCRPWGVAILAAVFAAGWIAAFVFALAAFATAFASSFAFVAFVAFALAAFATASASSFALAAFAADSASSFAFVAFGACATFAVCVTFVMLNLGNLHRVIFKMHSPHIACAAIVACAAHVAKKECHENDKRAHDDGVKPKEDSLNMCETCA